MEWIEANPLPLVCQECEANEEYQDCGACERGGERFYLSREDKLWLQRKAKIKAIQRLQRELQVIDGEIAAIIEERQKEKGKS